MELLFLFSFAFLAGLVDAVGGGGGLIQLPALLICYPTAPLPLLFGTNKFASAWGTGLATVKLVRHVKIPWHAVTSATIAAFIFSFIGAKCTSLLNPVIARTLIVVMLTLVLVYTVAKPKLGSTHIIRLSQAGQQLAGFLTGAVLGFYDGIFGPGTGSFLMLILVVSLGYAFITASAIAKVVNVATNVGAIMVFGFNGAVIWQVGIIMGVANISGAILGSRLAIKGGSTLVRKVFLIVTVALIIKVGIDTF